MDLLNDQELNKLDPNVITVTGLSDSAGVNHVQTEQILETQVQQSDDDKTIEQNNAVLDFSLLETSCDDTTIQQKSPESANLKLDNIWEDFMNSSSILPTTSVNDPTNNVQKAEQTVYSASVVNDNIVEDILLPSLAQNVYMPPVTDENKIIIPTVVLLNNAIPTGRKSATSNHLQVNNEILNDARAVLNDILAGVVENSSTFEKCLDNNNIIQIENEFKPCTENIGEGLVIMGPTYDNTSSTSNSNVIIGNQTSNDEKIEQCISDINNYGHIQQLSKQLYPMVNNCTQGYNYPGSHNIKSNTSPNMSENTVLLTQEELNEGNENNIIDTVEMSSASNHGNTILQEITINQKTTENGEKTKNLNVQDDLFDTTILSSGTQDIEENDLSMSKTQSSLLDVTCDFDPAEILSTSSDQDLQESLTRHSIKTSEDPCTACVKSNLLSQQLSNDYISSKGSISSDVDVLNMDYMETTSFVEDETSFKPESFQFISIEEEALSDSNFSNKSNTDSVEAVFVVSDMDEFEEENEFALEKSHTPSTTASKLTQLTMRLHNERPQYSSAVPSSVFVDPSLFSDGDEIKKSSSPHDSLEESDSVFVPEIQNFKPVLTYSGEVLNYLETNKFQPVPENLQEEFQNFDAGWEDIAHSRIGVPTLPVIEEVTEPSDNEYSDSETSDFQDSLNDDEKTYTAASDEDYENVVPLDDVQENSSADTGESQPLSIPQDILLQIDDVVNATDLWTNSEDINTRLDQSDVESEASYIEDNENITSSPIVSPANGDDLEIEQLKQSEFCNINDVLDIEKGMNISSNFVADQSEIIPMQGNGEYKETEIDFLENNLNRKEIIYNAESTFSNVDHDNSEPTNNRLKTNLQSKPNSVEVLIAENSTNVDNRINIAPELIGNGEEKLSPTTDPTFSVNEIILPASDKTTNKVIDNDFILTKENEHNNHQSEQQSNLPEMETVRATSDLTEGSMKTTSNIHTVINEHKGMFVEELTNASNTQSLLITESDAEKPLLVNENLESYPANRNTIEGKTELKQNNKINCDEATLINTQFSKAFHDIFTVQNTLNEKEIVRMKEIDLTSQLLNDENDHSNAIINPKENALVGCSAISILNADNRASAIKSIHKNDFEKGLNENELNLKNENFTSQDFNRNEIKLDDQTLESHIYLEHEEPANSEELGKPLDQNEYKQNNNNCLTENIEGNIDLASLTKTIVSADGNKFLNNLKTDKANEVVEENTKESPYQVISEPIERQIITMDKSYNDLKNIVTNEVVVNEKEEIKVNDAADVATATHNQTAVQDQSQSNKHSGFYNEKEIETPAPLLESVAETANTEQTQTVINDGVFIKDIVNTTEVIFDTSGQENVDLSSHDEGEIMSGIPSLNDVIMKKHFVESCEDSITSNIIIPKEELPNPHGIIEDISLTNICGDEINEQNPSQIYNKSTVKTDINTQDTIVVEDVNKPLTNIMLSVNNQLILERFQYTEQKTTKANDVDVNYSPDSQDAVVQNLFNDKNYEIQQQFATNETNDYAEQEGDIDLKLSSKKSPYDQEGEFKNDLLADVSEIEEEKFIKQSMGTCERPTTPDFGLEMSEHLLKQQQYNKCVEVNQRETAKVDSKELTVMATPIVLEVEGTVNVQNFSKANVKESVDEGRESLQNENEKKDVIDNQTYPKYFKQNQQNQSEAYAVTKMKPDEIGFNTTNTNYAEKVSMKGYDINEENSTFVGRSLGINNVPKIENCEYVSSINEFITTVINSAATELSTSQSNVSVGQKNANLTDPIKIPEDLVVSPKLVPTFVIPLHDTTQEEGRKRLRYKSRSGTIDSLDSVEFLTDSESEDISSTTATPSFENVSLKHALMEVEVGEVIDTDFNLTGEPITTITKKRKALIAPTTLLQSPSNEQELSLEIQSQGRKSLDSSRLTTDSCISSISNNNTPIFKDKMTSVQENSGPSNPIAGGGVLVTTEIHSEIIKICPMPNNLHQIFWESVTISGVGYKIDGTSIQKYKRVISHGGFYGERSTIIELFACYMPDPSIQNYHWVMDNLLLYVLATLELLAQHTYSIVLFVGSTSKNKYPSNNFVKRWHNYVNHRLRKDMETIFIVQPTFYVKTIIGFTRMFASAKSLRKIKYVKSLSDLKRYIPTEFLFVPDVLKSKGAIKRYNICNKTILCLYYIVQPSDVESKVVCNCRIQNLQHVRMKAILLQCSGGEFKRKSIQLSDRMDLSHQNVAPSYGPSTD